MKVTEADAIKYYEDHKAEFTAPKMYKLDGFAFATAKEAQAARRVAMRTALEDLARSAVERRR